MTTIRDLVTRAFKVASIVPHDETPQASEMAHGVAAFNDMVHAWKLAGVDLEHTDQDAEDTFSFGAEYVEGCVYMLAARLSGAFQMPVGFDPDEWFRKFQAANITIEDATMPTMLTRMPSRLAWRWHS